MPARLIPTRIADDVFEISVETPRDAQILAKHLRHSPFAEDVVAGLASVCVRIHPDQVGKATAWLEAQSPAMPMELDQTEIIEIEVQYGGEHGPDLTAVCAALDLDEAAFIALHTRPVHSVEMIGFTPGFAYISGLPEHLAIPRLKTPRPRVPAGSVGISAAYSGLYALPGPGGWPLIGRTWMGLFNPEAETPFPLLPGQRVRFKAA